MYLSQLKRSIITLGFFSVCFSVQANNSLWQYTSTSLAVAKRNDAGDVLSFTVPVSAEGKQISVGITFFSSYSSPTSCSGSLYNKAYNNVCVCPGYGGKTYYISQANLYKIINAFSPGSVGSVACARVRDNKNFSVLIYKQTTCSGGTQTCSNDSGTTAALPSDTTTGSSCSC